MKVRLVGEADKRRKAVRKPRRQVHLLLSWKLSCIPLGYLGKISKKYFVHNSPDDIRKFLKAYYKGHFKIIGESKTHWIVKRIETYAQNQTQGEAQTRIRRVRFLKRSSGDSKIPRSL